MKSLLKLVNGDVLSTQLNQLWRGISGIVTLVMIPLFLTTEQQGYWFTMTSLAALAMLADLGFFQVTLQFAAHEFSYLKFDNNDLVGSDDNRKRLASLFIFCIRWALLVGTIAFPVILLIGFVFLSQKKTDIGWGFPWTVYVAGGSLTFINSAILYFLEGCNLVALIQRIRLTITAVTMILMWLGLVFKFGLHALSLSMLIGALFGSYTVLRRYGRLFSSFLSISRSFQYSWRKQILGLLWKYSLSWSSGYFIFQVYAPLAFQFHGPVEAGKVGLSITLWMGVFAVSNSWVYSVTPRLNMLVAKRDWPQLDHLFWKNLVLSSATFIAGAVFVFLLVFLLKGRFAIVERLVDPLSLTFLGIAWFLQIIVSGLAVYLRAHKQEPLVVPSVVSAAYILVATLLCARYLETSYFFLGYLSSCIWGVPWVVYIFLRKKREWQHKAVNSFPRTVLDNLSNIE